MWETIFPEVKSYCTSENSYVTFTYEYEKALIFDKLLSREFMVRRNQQFEGTERINSHKKINASHVLEVIKYLEERSQKTLIYNDKT